MNQDQTPIPGYFLKPGEMFVSSERHLVSTLLGSCVAVTMVCRRRQIGAICHALLPSCRTRNNCTCAERFRFMDCAIRGMVEALGRMGVQRGTIEAKIFGGADMFHSGGAADVSIGVGSQNIARAVETVMAESIRVVASDVGGLQGRKLFFLTDTGEVYLKRLNRIADKPTGINRRTTAGGEDETENFGANRR